MVYTLYKITNKINGKIYVGVHQTNDIDDGYIGSGTVLKRAIKKYGENSFTKEILKTFDTSEEMFKMEAILVNEEFVKRKDTYNIKEGGFGGFDHLNDGSEAHKERARKGGKISASKGVHRKQQQWLWKNDEEWVNKISEKRRKIRLKYYADGGKRHFLGKHHTEEAKQKIGEANKKMKGEKNSQYGTCWIHSLILKTNKKIKKEELDDYLAEGWIKGRKMKFHSS